MMTTLSSRVWSVPFPIPLMQVYLFLLIGSVSSLRDDWYGFGSFEDPTEWDHTYAYTCNYVPDLFREPRQFSKRDDLHGRRELHTPIAFRSADTVRSPENITLHVYNHAAIRRAYIVSYGFQRNKECLHGQDAECVIYPALGKVRALVVTADRFVDERNLNFLKDHFLIEKPETYVSIINGGSIFERKFYEAVFLGGFLPKGFPPNPLRSSHQIDGKKYPLEIYMLFVDETVPAVSLSTILVVLVEESNRDNVHIRPIINAVEKKLYDNERRFLDRNKAMIRQQRLFHHMEASTYYDVYNVGKNKENVEYIKQESLSTSRINEASFTRYVEPFEKMQALEAELFFLLEDYSRVVEEEKLNENAIWDFYKRKTDFYIPGNLTEFIGLFRVAALGFDRYATLPTPKNFNFSCYNRAGRQFTSKKENFDGDFWKQKLLRPFRNLSYLNVPTRRHKREWINMTAEVCDHFRLFYWQPFVDNHNHTKMLHLTTDDKYKMIRSFVLEREDRMKMNQMVFEHFHGKDGNGTRDHPNPKAQVGRPTEFLERPEYANYHQRFRIVDGIEELMLLYAKAKRYRVTINETKEEIQKIVNRLDYDDLNSLEDIVRYLKHGSKQNDLKYHRSNVHEQYVERELPSDKKKRGLVEMQGMEIPEDQIKNYEAMEPLSVKVDQAFQISWLIPHDGGYYSYSGSSPVPPCFRAQNVIVFKKPIKMSRRQIDILTKVPTSLDRSEDIRFTTPRIHDVRFEVNLKGEDTEKSRIEEVQVPIYFQPRNHLFLGHDGVHSNSVEEWEKIEQMQMKKSAASKTTAVPLKGVLLICTLVIIVVR